MSVDTRERTAEREATEVRHQETHSPVLAPLGFMTSMALPAAVAVAGIAVLGWGAIDWASAVVWGIVATVAFTVSSMVGKAAGMTEMDLPDLIGSVVAEPGTRASKALGAAVHHANGAILAVAWAYGVALVDLPANWWTGVVWGVILTAFAMLMMSTVGAVHPAIRRGEQDDPGLAATNFGRMTPAGSLVGHAVYGAVLGLGVANWPIG